ncbi:MAG: T9SS type A sorting domain-containing protein [Ignavibacteriaceae bacterium]|nr:T9SS type A sorting domain-containing protein [Ignavibacteriaceae bacterium]
MKRLSVIIFISVMLFVNPQAQQIVNDEVKKKLAELSHYGVQYKFLDETTIELYNTLTGWKQIKTLKEPEAETIYNWANKKGIPVIEIDPAQVDTTKWNGWYDYWTYVLVSNADTRIPTQAYDFDGNGFVEIYGLFGGVGFDPEYRIFEIYPDGSSVQRYVYNSTPGGLSTQILDIDKNGLKEVVFYHGQDNYVYEQTDTLSLPTQLKFVFNKYDGLGNYLSIEKMAYMDEDTLIDFVHRGADTTVSPDYLLYVSEYNPSINNFEKTWYIEPYIPPIGFDFTDGFNLGDYDGDLRMEIISSSLWGKIRIVENVSDNNYEVIFQDSLPLVNMYYQASGDLDGDGKREFFIGATMGDGNWTTMFETDGDNSYTPKFIFHLLSGGSLDDPTYLTDDIDGDGKLEFAILSGGYLYVFKSDGEDSYYLWFLKKGPTSFTINFFDMNGDSIKDILWTAINDERWTSEIFIGTELINDVIDYKSEIPDKIELKQNYPNPFNPSTKIQYALNIRQYVTLKIYDLLGREITTLVDEEKEAGNYIIQWDADGLPSGIYMYRLQTEKQSIARKMLLIK